MPLLLPLLPLRLRRLRRLLLLLPLPLPLLPLLPLLLLLLQEVLQRHRINPQAADCQSAAWGGFRASAVKEGVDAAVRCDCRGCLRRW